MRSLFLFSLLALLAITGIYLLLENLSGYVLLSLAGYTVEMPFFVALILNVLLLLVFYWLFSFFRWMAGAKRSVAGWAGEKRRKRGLNRTTQGLVAFVEGRWDFARKSLEKAASSSSTPLVNYLFAARASSAIGDAKAVDGFLKKAELSTEGADIAIGLTQAELQLQGKQFEQALATLLRVKKQAQNHPVVLNLLAKVYAELGDWTNLLKLLPALKLQGAAAGDLDAYEQYACKSLLEKAAGESAQALTDCWKQLPATAVKRPVIIAHYAEQLLDRDQSDKAEQVLRQQLQRVYDSQLIEIYGRALADQPPKQLAFAQKLLKSRSDDGDVLLALARISLQSGLPEQAKDYYEKSLTDKPSIAAYAGLAELHASQGNFKLSSELYARGAQLQSC